MTNCHACLHETPRLLRHGPIYSTGNILMSFESKGGAPDGSTKNTNQYFRVFRTKRRCNLQRCNMIQDLRFKGNSRNPSGCILRVWIQDSRSFPAFLKPASSSKALHCISVNYNSFEQLVFQILTPTGVWNTGLRGFGLLIRQQKLVSQRTQKLNGWTMDRFS